MQLLLDIGNTRIKWAYADNEDLLDAGEVVHRGVAPEESLDFVRELATPESIYALNVAGPELGASLAKALQARFGMQLQMVRTSASCGAVVNGYTSIEQLGADRWAAMVGAWYRSRRAVIVVDAGTAITIDLVAEDGHHLGGIIVPGIDLMRGSLDADTSDIGEFARSSKGDVPGDDWYGRDTFSAVQRGAIFGARAVIEQALLEYSEKRDSPAIYLTGGDAPLLLPLLSVAVQHRPNLVLEGLQHLVSGG